MQMDSRIRPVTAPVAGLRTAKVAGLVFLVLPGAELCAQGVEIRGGRDPENDHFYRYVVINRDTSPVVAVDFPHFRADLFVPPDKWALEVTERNALEWRSGRCIATAPSSTEAIAPGRQSEFTLRIGPRGARVGTGTAVVTLVDGRTFRIRVECSVGESFLERYAALVGMILALGVFFLLRFWRLRRKRAASEAPAT